LKGEILKLHTQFQELKEHFEALADEKNQLRLRNESLQSHVEEKEAQNSLLEEKLGQLHAGLSAAHDQAPREIESLQSELDVHNSMNLQLSDTIAGLRTELKVLADVQINLDKASATNSRLESELERSKGLLYSVTAEKNTALSEIDSLQTRLDTREVVAAQLRSALDVQQALNAKKETQIERFEAECSSLRSDLDAKEEQIQSQQSDLQQASDEITRLQSEEARSHEHISSFRMSIEELNSQSQDAAHENARLQATCQREGEQLKSGLRQAREDIHGLEAEVEESQRVKTRLQERLQLSTAVNNSLREKLQEKNKEISKLSGTEDELKTTISRLTHDLSAASEELLTSRAQALEFSEHELSSYSQMLAVVQDRNGKLQEELDERISEIQYLSNSLSEKDKALAKAPRREKWQEAAIERRKESLAETKEQIARLEATVQKLQNQLESATNARAELEERGRTCVYEMKEKYQGQVDKLKKELGDQGFDLYTCQQRNDDLQLETKRLNQELEYRDSEIQRIKEHCAQMRNALAELKEQAGVLQEEKSQLDERQWLVLRNVPKIESLEDIPAYVQRLEKEKTELQNSLNDLCKSLRVPGNEGLSVSAATLQSKLAKVQQREDKLESMFPDTQIDQLPCLISQHLDQQRKIEEIVQSRDSNLAEAVAELRHDLDKFQNREQDIQRDWQAYAFERLPGEFSRLRAHESIIKAEFQCDDDWPTVVFEMKHHLASVQESGKAQLPTFTLSEQSLTILIDDHKALEQIRNSVSDDPVNAVESLVAERKRLEGLLSSDPVSSAEVLVSERRQLEELLQGDPLNCAASLVADRKRLDAFFDSDPIGSTESLIAERKRIAELLPSDSRLDEQVQALLDERRDIRNALPSSNDDLPGSVALAVQKNIEVEQFLEQLTKAPSAEPDSLLQRLTDLVLNNEKFDELKAELDRLREVLAQTRETLGCATDDQITPAVQELKNSIKAGKEVFEELAKAINGTHCHVECPLSDERRALLLGRIRKFQPKLE
jgi:chromosome segregation ATPase